MKIVVITQSEPFYVPGFFARFIPQAITAGITIERVFSLQPFNESLSRTMPRMLNLYGPFDFMVMGLRFVLYKCMNMLSIGTHSVQKITEAYNIPFTVAPAINSPEAIDEVRTIAPDVIVSIAASQIFRTELLSTPKWGCINVHTAKLPKYRGMLPTFWAMYHNDPTVGMTVFKMDKDIDCGKIIVQEEIAIEKDDTLESVIIKTKAHEADMVIRALQMIRLGEVELKEYEGGGSYFKFPTHKEAAEFRQAGKRFF